MFIFVLKIIFLFHLYFKILQRCWKLVTFGTLDISIHATRSNSTILQETIIFIHNQKINLFPLKILQSDWSKTFWLMTP